MLRRFFRPLIQIAFHSKPKQFFGQPWGFFQRPTLAWQMAIEVLLCLLCFAEFALLFLSWLLWHRGFEFLAAFSY